MLQSLKELSIFNWCLGFSLVFIISLYPKSFQEKRLHPYEISSTIKKSEIFLINSHTSNDNQFGKTNALSIIRMGMKGTNDRREFHPIRVDFLVQSFLSILLGYLFLNWKRPILNSYKGSIFQRDFKLFLKFRQISI